MHRGIQMIDLTLVLDQFSILGDTCIRFKLEKLRSMHPCLMYSWESSSLTRLPRNLIQFVWMKGFQYNNISSLIQMDEWWNVSPAESVVFRQTESNLSDFFTWIIEHWGYISSAVLPLCKWSVRHQRFWQSKVLKFREISPKWLICFCFLINLPRNHIPSYHTELCIDSSVTTWLSVLWFMCESIGVGWSSGQKQWEHFRYHTALWGNAKGIFKHFNR